MPWSAASLAVSTQNRQATGAGVAEWRLSRPAETQLAHILANSLQGWGGSGRDRYAALVIAAMQDVADDPVRNGPRQIEAPHAFTTSGTVRAVRLIVRIACVARGNTWPVLRWHPKRTRRPPHH
jgi:hypothetical protein